MEEFDRWVDNEERVGDFLWAANEPSGGTFQVKRNLFSRVCLKIYERVFIFVIKIFNGLF